MVSLFLLMSFDMSLIRFWVAINDVPLDVPHVGSYFGYCCCFLSLITYNRILWLPWMVPWIDLSTSSYAPNAPSLTSSTHDLSFALNKSMWFSQSPTIIFIIINYLLYLLFEILHIPKSTSESIFDPCW